MYDYGNIDEAIINYAGAAIYDDGSLAQPSAGPVSDQVRPHPDANQADSLLMTPGQP